MTYRQAVASARALKTIRRLARAARWELTGHAIARMTERGFGHKDILAVLGGAGTTCRRGEPGRWRLDGSARGGDPLSLSVEIRELVVVVTLFGGDEP